MNGEIISRLTNNKKIHTHNGDDIISYSLVIHTLLLLSANNVRILLFACT